MENETTVDAERERGKRARGKRKIKVEISPLRSK